MAEKISASKGFTPAKAAFDTYVPELSDNADIQNALELFYYGDSTDGGTTGDVSLYANIVDFDTRIIAATSGLSGHTGAISDAHGIGAGSEFVGTIKAQTLTNKTLTTPKINENVILTATSTELNILDGATLSTTEINYVDGVTSPIQTQINTNTPTGMISIHSGATAPTGWLLCDGTSYASASYTSLFSVVGYTFGGSGANFNVPNLKGKVVVGIDASQASFDVRGEIGGAMTHQHASSNTGSSGSHSHTTDDHTHSTADHSHNTADHSHYSDHSHYADHSHYVNPGSSSTSSDSHSHITNTNSANASRATGTSAVALSSHTHNTYSDSHSHTVNIATFLSANANGSGITTGNSNYGNTAGANAGNTTGGASAGNTTGGASLGNTTTTEPVHSHTSPASDIISNLQPYIALNYIIKI